MENIEKVMQAYGQEVSPKGLSFLKLLKPHWLLLFWGCILVMLTSLIMVFMPVLVNGGVSLVGSEKIFVLDLKVAQFSFHSIYQIIFTVSVLAIIGALVRTGSRIVIFGVGRSIEKTVRSQLFSQLSILDDRFYAKNSVGELMNHLTTDTVNVRLVAGFAILNIMNILFVFFLTVPFLLKVDLLLAICALIPFPLVVLATSGISRRMFQATVEYQAQLGVLTNHVQENLLGAHVVRLFHQQQAEGVRFQATNAETYRLGVKLARVRVLMMPVMRLVVGLSIGLVLYIGGNEVLSGQITLGQFVEVNARILQLAWPAMSIGFVMSIYSRGQASLERINKLFSYRPQVFDGDHQIFSINKLEVRDVFLGGTKFDQTVSFSLKRGQLLGVVGPSGSHKSSLLKTLYRRNLVPNGQIFYDGQDINNIKLSSLYEQISVVSSESFLFHKTIRENICFSNPEVSKSELDEVLRITKLDQDLHSFSDGLETIVGERGITLSGGQRQRIILARALLANRSVLILDDALSSVDAHTEQHIIENISNYLKNSLVIMATHRFMAIEHAHEILVMEKGLLVGRGTHEELLAKNILYQQLRGINQRDSNE